MSDNINNKIDMSNEQDDNYNQVDVAINLMKANLSKWLKTQRNLHNNISGRELARQSRVSSAVISDLECNKYLPKIEVLLKLIGVLNIRVKDLLNALWTDDNEKTWEQYITQMGNTKEIILRKNKKHPMIIVEECLKEYGLTNSDIDDVAEFISYKKFKNARRMRVNNKFREIATDCHENDKKS